MSAFKNKRYLTQNAHTYLKNPPMTFTQPFSPVPEAIAFKLVLSTDSRRNVSICSNDVGTCAKITDDMRHPFISENESLLKPLSNHTRIKK